MLRFSRRKKTINNKNIKIDKIKKVLSCLADLMQPSQVKTIRKKFIIEAKII